MRRVLFIAFICVAGWSSSVAAQTLRPFTHDLGTTDIPVSPQRIVSLHDSGLTIPLIELGVMPVGSGGRVAEDGSFFMRGALSLVKTDFANSDIEFVDRENFEAIAALDPDLIITNTEDAALLERYSLIAPAIVLNRYNRTGTEHLKVLADAAGVLPAYEALEARLQVRLAALAKVIPDASEMSVAMFHFGDGVLQAPYAPTYGALGHVLARTGFGMPAVVAAAGEEIELSLERIADLDADFLIGMYVPEAGETPQSARAALDAAAPGWCDQLVACRSGQIFWLPLDEAFTVSFNGMDLMMMALTTGIAGRSPAQH
jgi:iron complex transport system substrate-binding protein